MAASTKSRLPSGVRINNGAFHVRYIGHDGKGSLETVAHPEEAKYWHSDEHPMMDQKEWTFPTSRRGRGFRRRASSTRADRSRGTEVMRVDTSPLGS